MLSVVRLHVLFPPDGLANSECHASSHVGNPRHWDSTYDVTSLLQDVLVTTRERLHIPGVGWPKSAKSTPHMKAPAGQPICTCPLSTREAE